MRARARPDLSLATSAARGALIAAAVEVFAREGFAGARVEDVLAQAGIARRTFYKYFASKEDVLAAVYDLATTELVKAMRADADAAIRAGESPLVAIRRGLDVYLDYHVANAALLRVLVEQAIRSDSPLAAARQRFRRDLVRLLDDAVHASTGAKHEPMLYTALISALEGLSLDLLTTGAGEPEVARARRVMHFLLARVVGDGPPKSTNAANTAE